MKQEMKATPDFSRAFGRADKEFVYRVQSTVTDLRNQEEKKKMRKKIPAAAVVIALILLLSVGTAVALSLGWGHIEQAMDVAVESGFYENWSLDTKINLIESMKDDGLTVSERDMKELKGGALSQKEKTALADRILTDYYGDEEYLYYYTMAVAEWGEPQTWTLEQRYWFYQKQREKGLLKDFSWIDLLPEQGDLSQLEAEKIAKRAVAEAYGLTDEEMERYHGDVAFFITDKCDTPRWSVELYEGDNVYAVKFRVLLTREGEVTEDEENLGIRTPKQQREIELLEAGEASRQERIGQARLEETESVYWNPQGGKHYHFLRDCPAVSQDYLPLEAIAKNDPFFPLLTPCPCCVSMQEFWSLEDKIRFDVGDWEMPHADWLTPEQAVAAARQALEEQDIFLKNLHPSVISTAKEEEYVYVVHFCTVSRYAFKDAVFVNPVYTVILDPVTGKITYAGNNNSNG